MPEERNALAEIADELWSVSAIMTNHDMPQYVGTAKKASRIIAELSKVPVSSDVIHKGDLEISIVHSYKSKCLSKCRAIAEEGANND